MYYVKAKRPRGVHIYSSILIDIKMGKQYENMNNHAENCPSLPPETTASLPPDPAASSSCWNPRYAVGLMPVGQGPTLLRNQ